MKKDVTTNNIAEQVTKLLSVQNEALAEIIGRASVLQFSVNSL